MLEAVFPRLAVLCIIFLAVAAGSAHAEVDLGSLVSRAHGRLEWNSALGYGVIVSKGAEFSFAPGRSWGLLDHAKRIRTGAIRRSPDGAIFFTDKGAKAVVAALTSTTPPVAAVSAAATGRPRIAAIIIDPGHGGKDPGTISPFKPPPGKKPLEEKNIVLKIGLDVYHELTKKYPHIKTVITRRRDVYVSLERRSQIANNISLKPNEAKIFVSIHANASFDHQAHGYEVWYLPPSYQRTVVSPKLVGTDSKALLPILNNMREQEYETESVMLGKDILGGIHTTIGNAEVDRGLKSNDWYVVRNSKMPAVLVEVGFVSNRHEAQLLRSNAYLAKLARGIVDGISRFVTFFDTKIGYLN